MSRPKGLRVIAGSSRGRRLVSPPGTSVRPTKDIVREAMFSALDARGVLVGATVLDLYAGSGALAVEALSRGAERAVLVERDRGALGAIRANVDLLGLGPVARVVAQDVDRFLGGLVPVEAPFDLVFADPPYETDDTAIAALLNTLGAPGWLAPDALVSVERPVRHPVVPPEDWTTGWQRAFGDTLLTFCSR
jgi:16S rRNA (guanine966-N2)-methyltransferase